MYLPFAVLGSRPADLDVAGVAAAYRQRFGIEASYRQDNQVRARTSSRDPRLRLLLMGLAVLLTNLWVYLHATLVAAVPASLAAPAQSWLQTHCRLAVLRALWLEAIVARYHLINSLAFPFPVVATPKL
ncbi:MAG: hypothetical protein HY329_06390 [Chloroflexi bacterium]|nr:hypothetical protein [Chloroflexota bacterium]